MDLKNRSFLQPRLFLVFPLIKDALLFADVYLKCTVSVWFLSALKKAFGDILHLYYIRLRALSW